MPDGLTGIIISAIIGSLAVTAALIKSKRFFSCLCLSLISGIGSLLAVNLFSDITGVSIALNYITLTVSGIFGIPGVIILLLAI